MMTAPCHWIQKVTLSPPQVQTAWMRAETAYESPGSETQGKSLPSTNWLWPSASNEQVPPSPPQLIEWDQWRQWSVRRNWCGHQVQDSLTARLAWAPFDCWCTSKMLPYFCKTVLFLQPLRGIHRWQKSPKWPYQLFYYFSHGGGGGRQRGRNTFSALRLGENPSRLLGV